MMERTRAELVWEAGYILLVAVILANFWISYSMKQLSILPVKFPLTFLAAPFCGALIYLFKKNLLRAFYSSIAMCTAACLITGAFILMPSYVGITDTQFTIHVALKFSVVMALFVYPFAIGGSFVAGYFYPE